MKMRRKKTLLIVLVLIIVVSAIAFFFGIFKKDTAEKEDPNVKYYSQLTGNEVDKATSERPILGVMIENSEDARPQTGLDSAGIVFEAVTEGGITRYLALYQDDEPEIVGPVRSVRQHFLDWVMGFDASFAHVGGSAEALSSADSRNAKSLSQFKYTKPYYREKSRVAPHNMYARTKDLRSLQAQLNYKKSQFEGFTRRDSAPLETQAAQTISINFSSALYKVEFRYDKESNSYVRYLAGKPHMDAVTNQPIKVKNVIVIKTIAKSAGVEALGSGEALIFSDGGVEKVSWQKRDYQSPLTLTNATGQSAALLRGDSWFAAVGNDREVKY